MALSRRSFLGMAGTAATIAGLGLAGCGKSGNSGAGSNAGDAGVEPQNGSPATTPLDKLPIPEKGKIYNNPLERDAIKDGGTLVLPVTEIGPDFNYFSVNGNTTYIRWFWSLYNQAAVLYDCDPTAKEFKPNPNFVESSSVEDKDSKQVVTINLAEKAVFNDGTPIDWTAIKALWTCMNGQNKDFTPSSTDGFDQISSVEKGENDKQAIITFDKPYYPYEALMGALHPAAADPKVFNEGWVNNWHNEWGCGPFVIDKANETEITFVRNDKWWGDEAKLESITFKQMDAQAMFNAFKNGEIDATEAGQSGTAEMLSNFLGMENTEVRRGDSPSIACIEVNASREGLKDIAVRKAFAQCINTETILGIVYQGVNWSEKRLGSLIILPWMDGYESNLPKDVTDPKPGDEQIAAAKKTLEDAGYTMGKDGYYEKDGKQVAFTFTAIGDSNTVKNRAAAIQKMAKDAGMKIDIDNKPSSEFSKTLTGGNWDTFLLGWNSSFASYNNGKQIFGIDSFSNFTHTGSKELDEKFVAVTGISDHAEQMKAFNEAEKEALASYAFIPLYAGADCMLCKAGLANWGPALLSSIQAENIGWAK